MMNAELRSEKSAFGIQRSTFEISLQEPRSWLILEIMNIE